MTIIDTHGETRDAERSLEQRVAELEAANARLLERLESTTSAPLTPTQAVVPTAPDNGDGPTGTRRNLFKLAAGAAAGGTAAVLMSSQPAAAADTDPIIIGDTTTQGDTGRTTTVVSYTNTNAPQVPSFPLGSFRPANIMTVRDVPDGVTIVGEANGSNYPAAVGGKAYRSVTNGVYGFSVNGGAGVVGQGGVDAAGVLARGGRANIEMFPEGDAPAARSDAHLAGQLIVDANGDLWYCTADGTPGTWTKLAGAATAGAFHAVTPFRVYDSRQEGPDGLGGSTDNTIPVADARDVETYAVVTPDAVPAGATAISANVVAIGTAGPGFATINPGGDTSVGAAALNWADGQTIGNAGIFRISASREIEVLVRGITNIDLTVDVTGYWL